MSFWKGKKVLVTGGMGFVGSFVVSQLLEFGAEVTVTTRRKTLNTKKVSFQIVSCDCCVLLDARKVTEGKDIVINLAAHVAGIEYNRTHQATMLKENIQIAQVMLEAARLHNIERFLTVSSACVYPHKALIPTPETEGMKGEPEPTNGGYGWAKRFSEILSKYYCDQFGMQIGIVRPYNAYGPGDHFDDADSHVIPALITRVMKNENPFSVWGSGNQTRSFLYVQDLALGMLLSVEKYPTPDPINLGSDSEISIKNLIDIICGISGKKLKIVFDTSKPDGSPRRKSDNTKAKRILGFTAETTLRDGLQKTIKWYTSQLKINS